MCPTITHNMAVATLNIDSTQQCYCNKDPEYCVVHCRLLNYTTDRSIIGDIQTLLYYMTENDVGLQLIVNSDSAYR